LAYIKVPTPEWIDTPERTIEVCREIKDTGICALDTETTGKDDWTKEHIIIWSLCPHLGVRYCLDRLMLPVFKKEISKNPDITWVMTNMNFDNCMLANSGIPLMPGPIHCTLVMDWLHDENRRKHGLKETALEHLGLNMREFKKVFKKQKGETYQDVLFRMMEQNPDDAIDYASLDAFASLAVYQDLKRKLEREEAAHGLTMWDLFEKFEAPYGRVLYHNIRRGVAVDVGYLHDIAKPIGEALKRIQFKINKKVGKEINIRSPKQLIDYFVHDQKLVPLRWTSGGSSGNKQPSVDVTTLQAWAKQGHEVAKLIVDYRSLDKVRGTYVEGMIKRTSSDGRIHPKLTQHKVVTGRLSSTDPNLHNIPRPDDDVWNLRGMFMPRYGYTMAAADYAQLEMRILAHESGDENMRNVIRRGWDIHMGTASVMYGVEYDRIQEAKFMAGWLEAEKVRFEEWPGWITELMGLRQTAKSIGFGINYGEGDWALAAKLGITVDEARARKEKYFKPYPRVRDFIADTHDFVRKNKYVQGFLGHKRRLPDANHDWQPGYWSPKQRRYVPERPGKLAARALRQDVNSRIQGGAAVIAKLAQLRCENDPVLRDLGAEQLLQIHDEILFEIPDENLKECCSRIKDLMEHPLEEIPEMLGVPIRELSVPLDVDLGTGTSWMEAH